ncbi:hypothetical protein [Aureibacillus halotolerans]|nr:hypothetical protein [Aureibacillus halotolerans]
MVVITGEIPGLIGNGTVVSKTFAARRYLAWAKVFLCAFSSRWTVNK